MTVNVLITNNLGCGEADLPKTSAAFHELEQAGLTAETLSEHALLRCVRLAVREEARRRSLGRVEAAILYSQIHDEVVSPIDPAPELV